MKRIHSLKRNQIVILFIFSLINMNLLAQSVDNTTESTPIEILASCLSSQELWQQLPNHLRDVNEYYILDHGVNVKITQGMKIQGKSVFLINKGDANIIANTPYFLFHTFNVSETKAFARIFLTYHSGGEEKTATVELSFLKENNNWIPITNS